ncbi:DUF4269 domain-containing protein [Brevibacillus fluminis]|uniref:DUF4269 domain-containing protein n=1 Tax=Brevibacillus fluminis TaxID=511487 RepID=UPI003F8C144F
MDDFKNIRYLSTGTPRQQAAYAVMKKLGIMETLHAFDPILVGTIPLDIDIGSSDLDIVCCTAEMELFSQTVYEAYGQLGAYAEGRTIVRGIETAVIGFHYDGFLFELFAQPVPSERQNGYRHMVIEARMLAVGGARMRDEIRKLKRAGMKTEPAFMHYLQVACEDPYEELLAFETMRDEELSRMLAR